MNGINLISEAEITTPNMLLIWGLIVLVGTYVIWVTFYSLEHPPLSRLRTTLITIAYILVFILLLAAILGSTVFAIPTGRYKYQAKIDETVSLTEFFNKYDNISVNRGIYTFEDRK